MLPDLDPEQIAAYDLRPLTPAEQHLFPTLSLACDVFKARLAGSISLLPGDQTGWVVWMAETCPGLYLVALPGGACLHAEAHNIGWERVPAGTLVTTWDDVRAQERERQEKASRWRPGQPVTTPGTRLSWDSLVEWVAAWETITNRRVSSVRYEQESNHIQALPLEMIAHESDPATLYAFLDTMASGSGNRPRQGEREGHPTTEMVVEAGNRLAALGIAPYREYRRRQALRRALLGTGLSWPERQPAPNADLPHLSLF